MTSVATPTACQACGSFITTRRGLSHRLLDAVIEHVVLVGGLVASLWLGLWWPAIVTLVVLFLILPWARATRQPLVAITAGEVAHARRFRLYALASLAVFILAVLTLYTP